MAFKSTTGIYLYISPIADRLKIKETTLRSYFAEIRAGINGRSGAVIASDEALVDIYKEYLRQAHTTNRRN